LQAEFGARSSGPEQIHGTAIVVVLLTLGPSLADKERRKAAFRHGMVFVWEVLILGRSAHHLLIPFVMRDV
ncbi:hypothetical protein FocTR4_00003013, partial [Fusarium oxysporum f. sp. cubense]